MNPLQSVRRDTGKNGDARKTMLKFCNRGPLHSPSPRTPANCTRGRAEVFLDTRRGTNMRHSEHPPVELVKVFVPVLRFQLCGLGRAGTSSLTWSAMANILRGPCPRPVSLMQWSFRMLLGSAMWHLPHCCGGPMGTPWAVRSGGFGCSREVFLAGSQASAAL